MMSRQDARALVAGRIDEPRLDMSAELQRALLDGEDELAVEWASAMPLLAMVEGAPVEITSSLVRVSFRISAEYKLREPGQLLRDTEYGQMLLGELKKAEELIKRLSPILDIFSEALDRMSQPPESEVDKLAAERAAQTAIRVAKGA